jgi:hypothetical protein
MFVLATCLTDITFYSGQVVVYIAHSPSNKLMVRPYLPRTLYSSTLLTTMPSDSDSDTGRAGQKRQFNALELGPRKKPYVIGQ